MEKITGGKYENLAKDVVKVHTETGVKILGHFDEYGINQYRKSEKGIQFSFYWDGLDSVKTPDGSLSFGSKSGNGLAFPKAKESLIEYFGLVFIREIPGMRGECWFLYQATKNIPE